MKLDYYQNPILSKDEVIRCLLRGKNIDGVFLEDSTEVELFNRNISRLTDFHDEILSRPKQDIDIIDYHNNLSQIWLIPSKYYDIDLENWLLEKAETPEEKDRVRVEYKIYREKNLENLLRLMMYLVDSFRKNNILWGVGRGSSVASYILYLIGINRINPLKYDLKIEEFLK